jgi:hypothetical protein
MQINEAAKALKCRNFMWKQNKIISMDSMDYILYSELNTDKLLTYPTKGIVMNQRELSKIMKSITTESYFDISDELLSNTTIVNTINDSMAFKIDSSIDASVDRNLNISHEMDELIGNNNIDITDRLGALFKLNRASGSINFQYDDEHILTLFVGILPLAKSDKILINLRDYPNSNIFCVRFTVIKKIFKVYAYLKYIKI